MAGQLKEACIAHENKEDEEKFYQTINQVLKEIDGEYKKLDDDLTYVYELLENQTKKDKKSNKDLALADSF